MFILNLIKEQMKHKDLDSSHILHLKAFLFWLIDFFNQNNACLGQVKLWSNRFV